MQDANKRRENIVRFGLFAIPPVAWAIAFAPLYLLTRSFPNLNWISDALVPSLIEAVIVGAVCAAVWSGYKKYVVK
ncbi:MAG: hypothetical protein HY070_12565 [Chloroflexi bacterium]|nr:hypothetical protein [Chloroflexota bacterium]MBI3742651.1 hypothetical protein [Chloroflexota bacterium]